MRILWIILALIVLIVGLLYGLLFTAPGNNFVGPVIEKNLQAKIPIDVKLETYLLRINRFDIKLLIGDDSTVEAKGTMSLFSQSLDASYRIQIEELANLEKVIGSRMNGPLNIEGTAAGGQESFVIQGNSDFAKSNTRYLVTLKEFEPHNAEATLSHIHIDSLLHLVNKPIYASGLLNISVDFANIDLNRPEKIEGQVLTSLTKGIVHPLPVQKDFNLSVPENTWFKSNTATKIESGLATTSADIQSSIADLNARPVIFDLKQSSLNAPYTLTVPDLDKLFFVTKQHMHGSLKIEGVVETNKEHVQATAHSDTLGGSVDALFKDGKLDTDARNIQIVALTDMMIYPRIFDSRANAKLAFNTLTKKGTLNAQLLNGQFLPNKMSSLINQLAQLDITKEVYEKTVIDSQIDDKQLTTDFHLKSRLTELDSKAGKIDLDKQQIDTTIDIKIRKAELPVTLKGALKKPEISVDTGALLESKAKKEANKQLEKNLPKDIKESPAGDLLKKFF